MGKIRGFTAAAMTLILVSLLCLGLYRLDNKYTRSGIQPISGVLFYNNELTCLTRQWVCYPDVLLTPDTVDSYGGYRIYADIGGRAETAPGSVTYRLTLMLPDVPQVYALEIPEVFSASILYVDGQPLLRLGNPAPESYREGLTSRVVTFQAAGQTELLLAATDRSGVGRGMTFPPVFGAAEKVLALREARLLLHGGMVLLALLGILTAIVFSQKRRRFRGILTGLLGGCLVVITGYPLYHSLLTTAVQPWYTLEPLCHYGLLLLALWLCGSVFGLERKPLTLLLLPCAVGLPVTLIRFAAAAALPNDVVWIGSLLSDVLKWYTTLCLLGLSLWALLKNKIHSIPLLCGAVALAGCLVWDRLLPLYEPMVGCWFGELGGVLLSVFLASALWLDAAEAYRFRLTYEESYQQMQQRLAMQKEHYSQLSHQVRLAREANHDLRHHMRLMRTMAEQQHWQRLTAYLTEYESHLWEREVRVWSDHPVADAILAYYAASAKQIGASYDVRFAVPAELDFPDAELCILLSNLLENAMDAMAVQEEGPRQLYLRGQVSDGHLGIVADNTYSGELLQRDGIFLSTKHPGHGLGIGSVTTVVEKYGGLADFSADGHVFHTSIFLPLLTGISEQDASSLR